MVLLIAFAGPVSQHILIFDLRRCRDGSKLGCRSFASVLMSLFGCHPLGFVISMYYFNSAFMMDL